MVSVGGFTCLIFNVGYQLVSKNELILGSCYAGYCVCVFLLGWSAADIK